MGLENRKFKCKNDVTMYTLGPLQEDGYHNITWTHEDGSKDADKWRGVTIEKKFESGDWYYVNPFGGELADVVPIKSDGGSSSYYELTITNKAGESIKCETGDVIRALVGNDFDFGNCVKALRRMYLATLGMGKEGTDIPYDCNKVRYFLSEIERVNK